MCYGSKLTHMPPQIPDDAKPALDMLRSVGGDEMLAMMMQTFL